MLVEIEKVGFKFLKVDDMEKDSMLKAFYDEEGVKISLVVFFKRYHLNHEDDVILFCSVAVHKYVEWTMAKLSSIKSYVRTRSIPIMDKIIN